MKYRVLAFAWAAWGGLACSSARLHADLVTCPQANLGETMLDCPWAELARTGDLSTDSTEKTASLRRQWAKDRAHPDLLNYWGQSFNFDELAQGVIVDPEILRYIGSALGVTFDSQRIVHAGIEHTYGYLFSNLKTPYGYKRARWVSGEMDRGFGFHSAIHPDPSQGTLLANATALATQIAWGFAPQGAHPEIRMMDLGKLKGRRLEELVQIGKRKITLVTDVVEFPYPQTSNSALLVYSVMDTKIGAAPRLITLFPVGSGFASTVFTTEKLGPDQQISTRYNAFVEGLSGSPRKGIRREVAWPAEAP